ncbi:CAP domain-containing protein [Alkalihalobacillus sp. MEB130]|uniref:CAP domain-containing protein n=1 Tax=Alkalihalobacillus sp. MEB130 TaxID=2976704 RepID=UPI0028DFB3A4|nr:CAP domain-containing protein [Alkalihalobacillus sp. MEB130]MDT8859155.1 CAP domain-containing protein [Alkalihalobacillus sp. MEB130]
MKKAYVIFFSMLLFGFIVFFERTFEAQISEWFQQSEQMEPETLSVEEVSTVSTELYEEQMVTLSENEDLIGKLGSEIMEEFGEPSRIDLSAYGYDWWIYPIQADSYMQIGIEDNRVVTVFLTGDIKGESLSLGQTYYEINELLEFKNRVDVSSSDGGMYQFELSDEDLLMRPLAKVNDVWVQFFFDTHTEELSSLRMVENDVLIRQRPYSVSYRGAPPERPSFSEEEWRRIEEGNARQIFDYTNVIRERHKLEPFKWDDTVSNVAYLHSKDMSENEYFSHTSPNFGEVSDRFENGGVPFKLAGENIAAKYVDGLASVEGWLNSEGHRVNLLHEEFTHLGVGVFREHYTQNFLTPWQL